MGRLLILALVLFQTAIAAAPADDLVGAAERGDLAAVQQLLSSGVSVNAQREEDGDTALMTSTREGHTSVATFLVERNADLNLRNKNNFCALSAAASNNRLALLRLLLARGARVRSADNLTVGVLGAFHGGHYEALELLLKSGASPEEETFVGHTALMFAVERNDRQAVTILLQYGASANNGDYQESTAMHRAARLTSTELIERLVRAGGKTGAVNSQGVTPLMEAVEAGSKANIAFLMKAGVDPEAKDAKGRSARDRAQGKPDLLALLERK